MGTCSDGRPSWMVDAELVELLGKMEGEDWEKAVSLWTTMEERLGFLENGQVSTTS